MDRWVTVSALTFVVIGLLAGAAVGRFVEDHDLKLLIDVFTAVGTVGAVVAALYFGNAGRRESRARSYRDAAVDHLQAAVKLFLNDRKDDHGRPRNTRRHWLNFARAIEVAQLLASRIELEDQGEIWREQENIQRQIVFDALNPSDRDTKFNKDYYWPPKPAHPHKQRPVEIAEQSLVVIHRWMAWPKDRPDPLDRTLQFTEEEREKLRLFDGPGLADYLDERRPV